jgi:hypothetical protein
MTGTPSTGFFQGVQVNDQSATTCVTGIQVENVIFNNDGRAAVLFFQANGCSITSCSFFGQTTYGIEDLYSQTGNKFLDNTFDGGQFTILEVEGGLGPPKVIDYRASPAPTP